MIVGFTGSRNGMTDYQFEQVAFLLDRLKPEKVRHGDCQGADSQFHILCWNREISIIIHPPDNPYFRAFCGEGLILPMKPYLDRNRIIVDLSDLIIACPGEPIDQLRSGTWYTIRYARRRRVKLIIIYPENKG